jgi:uncharacterized membrane protein
MSAPASCPASRAAGQSRAYGWPAALAMVMTGSLLAGWMSQTILESELFATPFVSGSTWEAIVLLLGGDVAARPVGSRQAVLSTAVLQGIALAESIMIWVIGGLCLKRRNPAAGWDGMIRWGLRGWRWWCLAAVWSAALLLGLASEATGLVIFLVKSAPLWFALLVSLWLAEWFPLWRTAAGIEGLDEQRETRRGRRGVLLGVFVYTVVFTAMNWGLWLNLQIPHGDSAMYEEHLWNLEHGKGFRSYLDQGLFLGEHLQVIHVLLVPLHLVWPSHLLLELCQSLALALTALPVYSISRRHSGSSRAALYLALATLLYFPLQQLDISIDFKTFRPTAFGIPLLLAAIDQFERGRLKSMGLCLLLTLSTQEDFAIPIALFGAWLCLTGGLTGGQAISQAGLIYPQNSTRFNRILGLVLLIGGTAYLFAAVKVVIPWFRDGETVHYARYFARFGETPTEIVWGMLTQPRLVFESLVNSSSLLYAAYLLLPLGCLPLLSPSRLLIGLPLFVLLCLNELSQDPPGPFHHFHAPLVPLLLWSAAAGLSRLRGMEPGWNTAVCGARFALTSALVSGAFYTLSPAGVRFWDQGRVVAGRPTHWRALYIPDERARRWAEVEQLIPEDARVASTDFVHPRLTHRERSYDYSGYVRRVAGDTDGVPSDTTHIVIDLRHPYSASVLGNVRSAADVRERQERPDEWELISPPDDEFFVVLRRKHTKE